MITNTYKTTVLLKLQTVEQFLKCAEVCANANITLAIIKKKTELNGVAWCFSKGKTKNYRKIQNDIEDVWGKLITIL